MSSRDITEERIILALDHMDMVKALKLTQLLGDYVYAVKIHHLFLREGKQIVIRLLAAGAKRVWVDLKLHDTPDTVAMEAREIAESGAGIVSVHAAEGVYMMRRAVAEIDQVYAVTKLTSSFDDEVRPAYGQQSEYTVSQYASDAMAANVTGIVAPARYIKFLRSQPDVPGVGSLFKDVEWIAPAIRCEDTDHHDQVLVATPEEAIYAGATKLVIGREVTESPDQFGRLEHIAERISRVV